MPIDRPCSWTAKDAALYSVSVGLGARRSDLPYVYEKAHQVAFPTMPLGAMFQMAGKPWEDVNLHAVVEFDAAKLLHGEQLIEWTANGAVLPAQFDGYTQTETVGLLSKGSNVIALWKTVLLDAHKKPLCTMMSSMFLREARVRTDALKTSPLAAVFNSDAARALAKRLGGTKMPTDAPGISSVVYQTALNQHCIYRLNGDDNPIHIDVVIAKGAGLPAPILHGLCTFGFACRGLLEMFPGAALRAVGARFAAPVFPGDTLRVFACAANLNDATGDTGLLFQVFAETKGSAGPRIVITNGHARVSVPPTTTAKL